MKQKLSKDIHIINDLLIFCHNAGGVDYNIRLTPGSEFTVLELQATIPSMSEESMTALNDALKLPRMREVEQDYWELGSSSDIDSTHQLTLIGMMLDESSAAYENDILTITAKRFE